MIIFIESMETEGVKHLTNLIRIIDAYSHYMSDEEKEMMEQADEFLRRIEVREEKKNKPEMIFSSYR